MEKSLTLKNPLESDDLKLEVVRLSNDGVSNSSLSQRFGVGRTTISDFLNGKTYQSWWEEFEKNPMSGVIEDHHSNLKVLKKTRYILTSAQNNTFVHAKFFQSLMNMKERLNAQLIVGTFSYNKRGFQNLEKGEADWFDSKLTDYILDEPIMLAKDLMWCGELNILPTAVNPLSGLYSYTKNCSGIFPHAKMQLESVPTHKNNPVRMLYTTGAVTKRNYIQKKAGQKASFHHIFGALLVEVDHKTGDWFVRQLACDDRKGYIQDLDTIYFPDGSIKKNCRVEAITWGDIHVEKLDAKVSYASFEKNNQSMLNVLKPKYQFVHDVMDFEARNHHNRDDHYFRFSMYVNHKDKVKRNIDEVKYFLNEIQRPYCQTVIVESNHDLALKRWLREADYRTDPANALFFLECQLRMYQAIQNKEQFSILEWLCKKDDKSLNTVKFLRTDESFMTCNENENGIQNGCHGDKGNNGSKGSVNTFKILDSRYNIGHSHSACIRDGVYVAGVSMDIDKATYTAGASSWSHSHIVTYPNGKRTIITLKNGKWRL